MSGELTLLLAGAGGTIGLYLTFVVALVLVGRGGEARAAARFVPDCLVLVRRLLADARVPRPRKLVLAGLLAYLAFPLDLVPDFVPVAGQLDDVLGGISLNDVDLDQRRAGIGYWVASEWRGRGIATRAVRLLARWAFDELALARLEISCGPDNFASQRVAERCGFVREGLLRAHLVHKGRRRDSVVFGLLPA